MSTPNQVVVSQISDVTTVEITTVGPQGPAIVYYDSTSDTFKADATTTKLTLVDGGNF